MITIHNGDCLAAMARMEAGSVHTCVTSPPYFGLRDYGHGGQIGLEPTPEAFVTRLVEVFREVRRVLRNDGTLWLNLGDSYSTGGKAAKNLIGIPWRVAFALQADGWHLRQDIIWSKPNPMPESVTDRCTKAHEYIFLFSKSPRYFFDSMAIREPVAASTVERLAQATLSRQQGSNRVPGKTNGNMKAVGGGEFRNKRSVWTVTTKPFRGAHFATFPPDLIEPCVLAGAPEKCCSACGAPWVRERIDTGQPDTSHKGSTFTEGKTGARDGGNRTQQGIRTVKVSGDLKSTCSCAATPINSVVLDPFGGSGTTADVAMRLGRNAIIAELNPEYARMATDRVFQALTAITSADAQMELFGGAA